MTAQKKHRSPSWDLSDLYASITDSKILRDQKRVDRQVETFRDKYREAITKDITATELAALLKKYSAIVETARCLVAFAELEFSTHATTSVYGAFRQNMRTWSASVDTRLLFVELEISRLPKKSLLRLQQDTQLAEYRHFVEIQTAWAVHRLPEGEEKMLRDKSLTGWQTLQRLYDLDHSERTYEVAVGKKVEHMNDAQVLSLWHSPKPERRKAAAQAVAEQNSRSLKQSALLHNSIVYDFILTSRYRGFEQPEDLRHLENEVNLQAVEALLTEVRASRPIVHKHYRLKKQLLGLSVMHEYDKYAPVGKTTKKYSWEEAREMIVSSFTAFSPVFGDIADEFFAKRWIDGPPHTGKRSGAFCYYTTPKTHPYILVNFNGTTNDVMTLAHELGHGIHAYLARGQSMLHFDWPLTTAETASIFGEMILFDQLMQTLSPKEKQALVISKLENIFASVHRQIAMFEFEREVFTQRGREEVSIETLSKLWRAGQEDMFGPAVKISQYEDHWWSMIPHLVHYPFYVYAYAFGELLTLSLYAMYKKEGDVFVKKYLEFLSAGGSKSPDELLCTFGVDWSQRSFWKQGIQEIEQLAVTAQQLAD